MFESLCLRDLKVYAQANGWGVYQYRDSRGDEIDAVLAKGIRGPWTAFEMKIIRLRSTRPPQNC